MTYNYSIELSVTICFSEGHLKVKLYHNFAYMNELIACYLEEMFVHVFQILQSIICNK